RGGSRVVRPHRREKIASAARGGRPRGERSRALPPARRIERSREERGGEPWTGAPWRERRTARCRGVPTIAPLAGPIAPGRPARRFETEGPPRARAEGGPRTNPK